MGLVIKFFAFLLVLGLAGLFVLKGPDGQPFFSLDDFIPSRSTLTSSLEQVIPEQVLGGEGDKTAVYRWKDANGHWQFSDAAPSNTNAEQILVDTHLNSDIAPPAPVARTPEPSNRSGQAIFIGESNKPSIGTTVSPDKIGQLIDDANNVQNLLDNRDQQLQEALK